MTPTTPKSSSIVSYKSMGIESIAYSLKPRIRSVGNPTQFEKERFNYNQSLERLRQAGFGRHLRPQEYFGLFIDGLEGKISESVVGVCKNMQSGFSEWLSLAFERKEDTLIVYLDPDGFVIDSNTKHYRKGEDFHYVEKKTFDLGGLKLPGKDNKKDWNDLREFDENFIRFMFGRSFKELPPEIRARSTKMKVSIPIESDIIQPVASGKYDFYGSHSIHGYGYYYGSRGVQLVSTA